MLKTDTKKEQARTIRDYLETVFRHKNKAVLFFLAVVISSVIILKLTPGTYTSTSKLIVRRGRENVVLDPTTATGAMLPLYKDWSSELNSELEILRSRELVEDVVERLGPQAFLTSPEAESGSNPNLIRKVVDPVRRYLADIRKRVQKPGNKNGGGPSQMDRVVRTVEQNLQIHVQENSDIIMVSYTDARPELARQVVTLLIDRYLETRIAVRRAPGAYQFFTEQKEQLLDELSRVEQSIRTIVKEAGVLSLEESRGVLQNAMATVQAQQLLAQSSLAAANARVDTLRTMLTQQTSTDPKIQNGTILDPAERKDLQAELRTEETAQAALIAENREIDRQLARLLEQLTVLDKIEMPIRRLQREQALLEDQYRQYSDNQEQARIDRALDTEKISNVSVVQHASLPTEPDPSRKFFKLLAAMFMGLAGAAGIAFGADYMDPTLHSAADVSERLHLTTLTELPNMPREELNPFTSPLKGRGRLQIPGRTLISSKEYFQELCFKILSLRTGENHGSVVIGITASSSGEGVSTIAANLADAFSRDDRFSNTLLLDANVKPLPVEWTSQPAPFTYQHFHGSAESGESEPQPSGITAFIDHLARLKKQDYDIIVVDIPPVSEGGYAIRAAAALDVVILAVEAGRVPWRIVLRTAELLTDAKATLGGIILNRQRFAIPAWLYRKL